MDASAQPLYDLSPLFWLLLVGVLTALGPLAWVWGRNRGASSGRRLQALCRHRKIKIDILHESLISAKSGGVRGPRPGPFQRATRYGSSKGRKSCSASAPSIQAATPGRAQTRSM